MATVVEGDQKAPFSKATTPKGGRYSFPWFTLINRGQEFGSTCIPLLNFNFPNPSLPSTQLPEAEENPAGLTFLRNLFYFILFYIYLIVYFLLLLFVGFCFSYFVVHSEFWLLHVCKIIFFYLKPNNTKQIQISKF